MSKHNDTKRQSNKKYNGTYPIVFGKDCTIHPDSLKLLKLLGVNIDNVYQYLGLCLAKHYQLCVDKTDKVFKNIELEMQLDSIDYQEILVNKDLIEFG